jgi:hypothetical protein
MDCTVRRRRATSGNYDQWAVILDKPVRGIALGQYVVFYGLDGLVCFGGGPITGRGPTYWEQGRALPCDVYPASHNDRSIPCRLVALA